ncbi:hypothetical protein, partial [Escherichia coli]
MPVIETKLTGRRWLNGIMLQGQKDETSGITVKSGSLGNDSNLLIVFYVQIMPDDFVMQLHR